MAQAADPNVKLLEALCRRQDGEKQSLQLLSDYYEGTQPLSYMHPDLLRDLNSRIRQVVVNWPRLVADTIEERLDVEGFRYETDATGDDSLWAMWQGNDLDYGSQQTHLEALVMRRSFVVVGAGSEPDMPRISVESPLQMTADFDPQTREIRSAVKRWCEGDTPGSREDYATLYLPNQTIRYGRGRTGWEVLADGVDAHGLGKPPVVVFPNRGRMLNPWGVSELADVIPLSDAACKIATDMMVSAEFHAMPRRWALGLGDDDFKDEAGEDISAWSIIAGRIWNTEKTKTEGVELGQFPEASLSNFHETLNQLARLVSSLSGLPPQFLGFTTDNPASADAIRSSESRLVKRAERKQRAWGESWERVMRLALRIRDGEWDPAARSLETMWRDPSTPTDAQKADASVKLHTAGIVPTEQAREDLGYTTEQRKRMLEMDQRASTDPTLERIARDLTGGGSGAPAVNG